MIVPQNKTPASLRSIFCSTVDIHLIPQKISLISSTFRNSRYHILLPIAILRFSYATRSQFCAYLAGSRAAPMDPHWNRRLVSPVHRRSPDSATFRTVVFTALLRSTFRPISNLEDAMFSSYSTRLTYILASLQTPEFDPLTPDPALYADRRPALHLTFFARTFTLSLLPLPGQRRPSFDLPYDPTVFDVLDSLETGEVSRSLLKMLEKMKFSDWDRGESVAHVVDCRYAVQREFHMRLAIGNEVLGYQCRKMREGMPTHAELEFERQALLLIHPEICVDRSPAVARFASLVDWRKKMWAPREPRQVIEPEKVAPVAPVLLTGTRVEWTTSTAFELTDDLRKMFEEATQKTEDAGTT
jgi:hypothetical protein